MGDIEKGFILGFLTGVFMTALLLGWLLGISREDDCWIPIEVRSENPTNMFYNCKMWGEIK